MTWEEVIKNINYMSVHPQDGGVVTFEMLIDRQRELLKAFADELVKRMNAHQFFVNIDPTGELELRASDVRKYINDLLNEAGVPQ